MAKPATPRGSAATSARAAAGRASAVPGAAPLAAGGRKPRSGRPEKPPFFSPATRAFVVARTRELLGFAFGMVGLALMVVLGSYDPSDPSWNSVPSGEPDTHNLFGTPGAHLADLLIQSLGWAAFLVALVPMFWGWRLGAQKTIRHPLFRLVLGLWGVLLAAMALSGLTPGQQDPLQPLPGGSVGKVLLEGVSGLFGDSAREAVSTSAAVAAGLILFVAMGLSIREWLSSVRSLFGLVGAAGRGLRAGASLLSGRGALAAAGAVAGAARGAVRRTGDLMRHAPRLGTAGGPALDDFDEAAFADAQEERDRHAGRRLRRDPVIGRTEPVLSSVPTPVLTEDAVDAPALPDRDRDPERPAIAVVKPAFGQTQPDKVRSVPPHQHVLPLDEPDGYELPPLDLLQLPPAGSRGEQVDESVLRRNAESLEGVLSDFGVRGEVQKVHPGPVVTLYELEPAPGTKSSRVIGLADDIARSMSAVSVRVAVVPGRNVIGIELPNAKRETVLLREMMASDVFERNPGKLVLALGKDIGGQPIVADLARFPHLLVAGTTGSGKSVAINTMILSLLYRLPPERCRFIMIDPKMLELSVYEGIPHLLTPVVTDPKKAVVALKWTVREMEDRYRNMSKLGVRNIEGYNARLREARENGESLTRRVQTGFDPDTGKPIFEEQPLDLTELPYIVVIVDEMADLMLVAGKDIEAAIQRLAQMARAAGIHLIMATQRPSVDVITGTIKANFPTRISFQVTSKIDSRTILGEQGAEQLLGQGDMLYMAGGGRVTRVHGPFVADGEVEQIVKFLKAQGEPSYVDAITEDDEEGGAFDEGGAVGSSSGDEMYDKAVAVVCRERKASTSFIQRQLRIGYNSAARLIERMEAEGVVSKPNHAGKREVLARNIDE
ncbi:DNA translocase FtsK [Azospirillum sp. SYSU D00513]|uniref:DNA translocase FtsK n=1 Tax=Azospirillum sp. SYSU D00513 TaxID=2812561 RepID=UPI001A972B6F|nr:DNA translocase FtsK [Azospirillum sp. SYSU D00513]